ncbi:MAG: dynamin family protein [Chloroflexota bacterium]|nr:dynamin family protein [Chloroflexota bacterium]
MLEVLPKIDGLAEDRVSQVRDALFHADNPYLIVFVGPFSSGKSSLINALLGEYDVLPTGITPTTDRITMLRWGEQLQRVRSGDLDTIFYPSPLLQKVSFVDTPGLESIFQTHEDTTRKFLHRSDTVLLVMLATQAMTQSNVDYLKILQEYGKTVIVLLNQVDLLSPEELATVKQYIEEQARDRLGDRFQVWAMSAKRGMAARTADGALDKGLWEQSGLHLIEAYVDEQLGDVARLRQKLQTPLQIAQNVHSSALTVVNGNQRALDQYQSIAGNIDEQLSTTKREQERSVRDIVNEVEAKFSEAAHLGGESIQSLFQLSGALRSLYRGLMELFGLSGLARRAGGTSYTRAEFDRRKAFDPIRVLPNVVDKVGPRLEGRDIQDIDDLVKYAKREIGALPDNIRTKVIGSVQAPLSYDRAALKKPRAAMDEIAEQAMILETDKLERAVRNAVLYLAGWVVFLLILGVFVLAWNPSTPDAPALPFVIVVFLLILAVIGMLFLPLRGRMLRNAYVQRVDGLKARYVEALQKAADEQVEYGMRLRRETVAPLTRLIDAQTRIQTDQLAQLQAAQQDIMKIESDLAALGKTGLRG